MRGYFITGTGTEVGKTLVTAALRSAMTVSGLRVGVMKPFATGCGAGEVPVDVQVHHEATSAVCGSKVVGSDDGLLRWGYAFAAPCSPHLAAERAEISISTDAPHRTIQEMAPHCDVVLVEGSGGVLVPLSRSATMLDFAVELALPVLIVVDNTLGCINHALLTAQSLAAASVAVAGIVMTETSPRTEANRFIREDNPRTISEMSGLAILAELPHRATLDAMGWRALSAVFEQAIAEGRFG